MNLKYEGGKELPNLPRAQHYSTPLGPNWVYKYMQPEIILEEVEKETGFLRQSYTEFGRKKVRRVPIIHG